MKKLECKYSTLGTTLIAFESSILTKFALHFNKSAHGTAHMFCIFNAFNFITPPDIETGQVGSF